MKKMQRILLAVGIILLILLAAVPSLYFYNQYQQEVKKNSPQAGGEELQKVKTAISKHIELPEGEEPVLATVSDTKKLKDQPFFQKGENGDKVLIFTKARKAYLYRPSTDKIIEVATVNLNSDLSKQQSTPSDLKAQEIRVVLRNGSGSTGLANKIEAEIKNLVPNVNIIRKENAAKNDYQKTLIVSLNENAKSTATSLAKYFTTTVSNLSTNENRPNDMP